MTITGSGESGGIIQPELSKAGNVKALVAKFENRTVESNPEPKSSGLRSTIGTEGALKRISNGSPTKDSQSNREIQFSKQVAKVQVSPVVGGEGREPTDLTERVDSVALETLPSSGNSSLPTDLNISHLSSSSIVIGGSVKTESGSKAQTKKSPKELQLIEIAKNGRKQNKKAADEFKLKGGHEKVSQLNKEIGGLEADLKVAQGKITSRLRSVFPGGKINRIKQQLKASSAELNELNKLKDRANVYEESFAFLSEISLRDGETLRTETPEHYFGGYANPTNNREVDKQRKAILANRDELSSHLIQQIPKVRIDFSKPTGEANLECDPRKNNNYLLCLDNHNGVLDYDAETRTLTLKSKDGSSIEQEITLPEQYSFDPDSRTIIQKNGSTHIMCDQAKFSEKTFDGHVRMASFNDGNGHGSQSKAAAEKANESSLKIMEDEIGKLYESKENVTSRDILRIHDQALMTAQEEMIAHNRGVNNGTIDPPHVGSTCPQLMTVAGDLAHISVVGDTKCFVVGSDFSVRDPTEGIRGGFDAKDPGGRIGCVSGMEEGFVTTDDGHSGGDLRNYSHCLIQLNSGDNIVMCSDGIADNLDPANQGLSPEDCGLEGESWDPENSKHNEFRDAHQASQIQKILVAYKDETKKEKLDSADIGKALNQFVQNLCLSRKIEMIRKPNEMEPASKKDFPGKLDHAGMLVYSHP